MNPQRWQQLSLVEQLGNIASETSRMVGWLEKGDKEHSQFARDRVLELLDLTRIGSLSLGRQREIGRLREVLCDVSLGSQTYRVSGEQLKKYLLQFAVAARR